MLAVRSFAAPARRQCLQGAARAWAPTSVQVYFLAAGCTGKLLQDALQLLTIYLPQARRQYATDFSEKEKVAKFHGQKGSDVRLFPQPQ